MNDALMQALIAALGALLIATVTAITNWLKAKQATALTGIAITGIEKSIPLLEAVLKNHGIEIPGLANKLNDATKTNVQIEATKTGNEPAMNAEVKKVTQTAIIVPGGLS